MVYLMMDDAEPELFIDHNEAELDVFI